MLQGAMLAGMAFANAPVAAVHALAYPIGGHFHVPHGHSNALVLLPVLRFNVPAVSFQYAELSRALRRDAQAACEEFSADGFVQAMEALVHDLGIETRLRDVGVADSQLPMLARDAMKVERLLVNNPREVSYDDALALYREAY
jgi:alcohol dehydrogenase class IV